MLMALITFASSSFFLWIPLLFYMPASHHFHLVPCSFEESQFTYSSVRVVFHVFSRACCPSYSWIVTVSSEPTTSYMQLGFFTPRASLAIYPQSTLAQGKEKQRKKAARAGKCGMLPSEGSVRTCNCGSQACFAARVQTLCLLCQEFFFCWNWLPTGSCLALYTSCTH